MFLVNVLDIITSNLLINVPETVSLPFSTFSHRSLLTSRGRCTSLNVHRHTHTGSDTHRPTSGPGGTPHHGTHTSLWEHNRDI